MSLFGHKKKRHKDKPIKKGVIADNRSLYNADGNRGAPLPASHWIDDKLLLCVHPSVADYTSTSYDRQIAIPLNTVFDFESLLFCGKAIVRAVDLPSTDRSYFRGRNRKMDFTFQGQFKRKICFDSLYTGQVFDKAFTRLPGQYIIAAAIKVIRCLAPSVKGDINSSTPHMISPLASAAQVFEICKPGEEMALPHEPKENVSLLDKKFEKMKFSDRKNYFHNTDNLSQYYFVPGLVYTISCYSHMISPTSYCVHLLGMKWGIHQYLPSPMQIAILVLPEPNTNKNGKEIESESNGNTTDTTDTTDTIEIIDSEELECESKDDEHEYDQFKIDCDGDLSKCEFLVNFQVWHKKLLDELWPKQSKHKKQRKSSIFG